MSNIQYFDTATLGRDAGFGRSFAASPRMVVPQFNAEEETSYEARWFNATFSAQSDAQRQGASAFDAAMEAPKQPRRDDESELNA